MIASNWKSTLVFHVNKLVRENDLFCSEKVRVNEFCRVVGTMVLDGLRSSEVLEKILPFFQDLESSSKPCRPWKFWNLMEEGLESS